MKIKVYKILNKTNVEGPGCRFCIWTQGCSRRCKGCWQSGTWDFNGGEFVDVEKLYTEITNTKGIEGVTFLGGEPFEQPEAVSLLAGMVKKVSLSVVTFTGYYLEELINLNNKHVNRLLENTDLLIDGPFVEELYDLSRPWTGSANQRYHFLTNRYNSDILAEYKNKLEIRLQKNGCVFVNGMGNFKKTVNTLCTM